MGKFTNEEQRNEIVTVLEQKPEIDKKIEYYKETMLGLDGVMKAIDDRIKKGYKTETFKFLGIPVVKRVNLDGYDKSKLILEKKRAELDLFEKKRYFDMWNDRKKDYDKKYAIWTGEVNENFEKIFAYAKEVSEQNPRLANAIERFGKEENSFHTKMEFYFYIKQEVENAIKHGKFKPKVVHTVSQPQQ